MSAQGKMSGQSIALTMVTIVVKTLSHGPENCTILCHAPGKIIVIRSDGIQGFVQSSYVQGLLPSPTEKMFGRGFHDKILDAEFFLAEVDSADAIIILADYQYKEAFVANSEINRVAALATLMAEIDWK